MYQLKEEEVIEKLQTSMEGLTIEEAENRLIRDGKNELPKEKQDRFYQILFRQCRDPIVILLTITVLFSLLTKEWMDAIAIALIILGDLFLGTIQEWNAEKNASSLKTLIHDMVLVIRNGVEQEIESEQLVVGDLVLLESGDKVSADLRLIETNQLVLDESILTGESQTVEKNTQVSKKKCPLADRKNMAYAGTVVVRGRGKGFVVAVATKTELGKIAHEVVHTKETKSPLTIRMEKFSKQISIFVVFVALLIALVLIWKQVPGSEIFLSVIALSVSAMPEGLPLAQTMALTIASNKMAKKNVIVKRLNSVESLGSCTVIATDKTGTLTVNEQTAKQVMFPSGKTIDLPGTGYQIEPLESVDPALSFLGLLGRINNEAEWNGEAYLGDSIDIAFLVLAQKLKLDQVSYQKKEQIPYESERQSSAVSFSIDQTDYVTIKGSLEAILKVSSWMRVDGEVIPIDRAKLQEQNEQLAHCGYRVIALASKKGSSLAELQDLIVEGIVAFMDPVREEVKDALTECKTAGIKVVMITGDHPFTAYFIAHELELAQDFSEVATGIEVANAYEQGEEQFDEFLKTKTVFARVAPLDKLHIVDSYKRRGEFVAVTGDGVNDAPAIRSANLGIAMGSGTDVARETASMIIQDDNFNSIVAGVKEGRTAYSNIRKVSYMLLSCGVAEVLFFLLSILFDLPMPLVAIQLLWLNIVTDGLQDFALSFEKSEPGIMKEPPRNPKEAIFDRELLMEVLVAGIVMSGLVMIVWYVLIEKMGMDVSYARGYIMMLMVFLQNIHVFNCRSEKQSAFHISLTSNPFIFVTIVSAIVLQIIMMEVPFLSHFLKTESIPVSSIFILFGISFLIFIVMEGYKRIRYRHSK